MASSDFRWTQDEWDGGKDLDFRSRWSTIQGWTIRHAWLFRCSILAIGFILFDLTANAAVATAVACLEFGRTDFGTAWWLRRQDPDPIRRSICQRSYLTWGLGRVSLVGLNVFVAILIGAIVINESGLGPVEPPEHVLGALGLVACTVTLASALSLSVVWSAFRHGIKIWLGPEPRWARRQGVWPPSAVVPPRGSSNQANIIFYMGCLSWVFPTLVVALFQCMLVPSTAGPIIFLGIVILILAAACWIVAHLERRVLARAPTEFWPIDDPEPVATL